MAVSFNVDIVRRAFDDQERQKRKAARAARVSDPMEAYPDEGYPWRYVKEQWTDFLIVCGEGKKNDLTKVPYTVDDKGSVTFGEETPIKVEYVPLSGPTCEKLWENPHGPAVEKLVSLTVVRGHTRRDPRTGKTQHVNTYTDSRGKGGGAGGGHEGPFGTWLR